MTEEPKPTLRVRWRDREDEDTKYRRDRDHATIIGSNSRKKKETDRIRQNTLEHATMRRGDEEDGGRGTAKEGKEAVVMVGKKGRRRGNGPQFIGVPLWHPHKRTLAI